MVYFGNHITKKDPGTLYFVFSKTSNADRAYCYSNNFNVISKVAALYGTRVGGIWTGNEWIFRDSSRYKQALRRYHNVYFG